ncbi:putative quinol monooxygenase [Kordiimonas aquimaris]|uniref:putative quinol monooxygenase n=1 Tax=Kordiimonas aquimaris TaxID=707591 RepID=UPI0021D174BF|nr:putative quinol monooxygenase [Kordiimonas aquimaris]
MSMVIVVGSVITTPDTHDEMLGMSLEHCARSRAEPGCIAHNVHVDCENPAKLVFVEYWADIAALKTHFGVPESQAFASALTTLAAGPPDMKVFAADEVKMG